MDVQMPVMDGVTATQEIRKDERFSNLPILAMTANVFKEDRLACLEAGMEDFIGKPVEPSNLFSTIIKWLPGGDGALQTPSSDELPKRPR